MRVVWTESQFDERPRIRSHNALPALVGLVPLHRFLRRVVPDAGRTSIEVVLSQQRILNIVGALRINFLLAAAAPTGGAFAFSALRCCLGMIRGYGRMVV